MQKLFRIELSWATTQLHLILNVTFYSIFIKFKWLYFELNKCWANNLYKSPNKVGWWILMYEIICEKLPNNVYILSSFNSHWQLTVNRIKTMLFIHCYCFIIIFFLFQCWSELNCMLQCWPFWMESEFLFLFIFMFYVSISTILYQKIHRHLSSFSIP